MGKSKLVDDYIDYNEDEKNDDYSTDDLYNITSWGADLSFHELITQYKEGDLLKPELQRNYVWDKTKASHFIDSLLLGLPLPSIFLTKTPNEQMLIIDGYQRIMTVHDYVEGIFSKDNKVFNLSDSTKINERWRGKTFKELTPTEQRKILITTNHCIIFVLLHPKDGDTSLYQIFERINTTSRTLYPQEIRNRIYQGAFNDLLRELNKNPTWRKLYGSQEPDARMRDMEFILRFLALNSDEIKNKETGQISLKKFLNAFMGMKKSNKKATIAKRKNVFTDTVEFVYHRFGKDAFKNISIDKKTKKAKIVNRLNPTIFDSIMCASEFVRDNPKVKNKEVDFKKRRLELLRNDEYQDLIRYRTTNVDRIKKRISLASKILYGVPYE